VGRNNNSTSGLNNSEEKKEDDSSGAFSTNRNINVLRDVAKGGNEGNVKISVVGHNNNTNNHAWSNEGTNELGCNNNSKVEIEDTTGGISDVGRNNNEKSDNNGGISGIGGTGGTDVTGNNNNSKETTVDATGAISNLGHNSTGNSDDDVVMTDIPGATGKGGNNKVEIIDLQDSDDDAKPAAAEDFLTARKKKMNAANDAFQENLIYKYYPDGAFLPTEVATHWKTKHNRIWSASPAPKYYYSKKDGNDKKLAQDMIVKHVAHPFSNIHTDVTWRNGELADFLKLCHCLF